MFITRECDYAVRVVRALKDEKKISVSEICEKEMLTAPFAYKILKKLQKAGIVKGYRGAKGGYTLKKSLSELTLLEIYRAIESDLFLIECMDPEYKCMRNTKECGFCTIHKELKGIQTEVWRLLQKTSIQELLA